MDRTKLGRLALFDSLGADQTGNINWTWMNSAINSIKVQRSLRG